MLTHRQRFEVFKRDNFTCVYCGAYAPDVELQVDHIHPVSKGGTNHWLNLATACVACNQGKSAGLLGEEAVARVKRRIEFVAFLAAKADALIDLARSVETSDEACAWDAYEHTFKPRIRAIAGRCEDFYSVYEWLARMVALHLTCSCSACLALEAA